MSRKILADSVANFNKVFNPIIRHSTALSSTEDSTCPHIHEIQNAKPYSEIPGPKPIPILGNTWRLLPIIGQYDISDVAKLSELFYKQYGKIMKLSGLVGRPDLLFVYDADEIEKIYRNEGSTPFRPSMPCLVKYKSEVRKEFFGDVGGVVGVCSCNSMQKETAVDTCFEQIGSPQNGVAKIKVFEPGDEKQIQDTPVQEVITSRLPCELSGFGDLIITSPMWRPFILYGDTKPRIKQMKIILLRKHGEPWKNFRSKVQRPILQLSTVKKYIGPIEDVTNYFIKRMLEMKDDKNEMPADFDNEIHKWSLECIGRVSLDARLGCLDPNLPPDSEPQKIIDAAKYALRNVAILELKFPFWRYFPTSVWTNYVKNMDYFIEVCMKHIDAAMERLKSKTVTNESDLSLVERILASEPDPKTAYILALDLILVGIDTISMAVCSILYQLSTRPEEQEKMYEELKRLMPDPETPLTSSLLNEMSYLKSFVKEVLRMYSTVIGNGRTLQQDTIIKGYHVPKGIQVVFPTLVTGSMSEFVSEPENFLPERWMKHSGENFKLHPYASLPYGHGARMCLGRRFSDLEIQVLLAKLIRSFKLEYHYDPLEYKVTFMYAPEGDLKLRMLPRKG